MGLVARPSTGLGAGDPGPNSAFAPDLPVALGKVLPLSGPQFSRLHNGFNKTSFTGGYEAQMRPQRRKFIINWKALYSGEDH